MLRACEQILLSDNFERDLVFDIGLACLFDVFELELEDDDDEEEEEEDDDVLESDDDGPSDGSCCPICVVAVESSMSEKVSILSSG